MSNSNGRSISSKLLLNESNAAQLVKGKRVLLRVDFNVPLDADRQITSDLRIKAVLPTLRLLLEQGGAKCVILASHLGRPGGKRDERYSLKPVGDYLAQLMSEKKFTFLPNDLKNQTREEREEMLKSIDASQIVLLENLRFYAEEEASDKRLTEEQLDRFASILADLADVYVNDAFGTAHRAHASMVGVARRFETRAAGLLMGEELRNFAKVLEEPHRPVLCIVGGAKVVDKIALLNNLLEKCDKMIVCGGMSFTFLKVLEACEIGKSLFDSQSTEEVRRIAEKAKRLGKELILPHDFIIAEGFDSQETSVCGANIPQNMMALDCGPKSRDNFAKIIKECETILWNGPPGVFEKPQFEAGSVAMLEAICGNVKAVKVAGGGDTTSLVIKHKCESKFDLVSTGGGASLELLEGKTLPGVEALSDIK